MNLFDRAKKTTRRLAEKRKPRANESEIGVSGDFTALYNKEEARKDDVDIEDYRRMLDNDGTVEAVYNLLTLPIKAAAYHFEVDDGGEAELEFVKENFELPAHKGGMSIPFDLVLSDMLRAIVEGFRLYEKVWTLREGRIVYRKLAPRDSTTITLKRDDHGGFAGAQQTTWNGSTHVDVHIPIERCYLFTYGKERDYLYGRSAFKSAHYHYDRKHRLYYLQELGAQTSAVPPRKLRVPKEVANNEALLAQAEGAADKFGVQQRITLPDGYDLEEYETNPKDLDKSIVHHDTLIARSVLAQFLVLAGNSTGSYALGESDKDNFMNALRGVMKEIERHVNAFLIPDLVDYNFGSNFYPEFRFEDISADTKKTMSDAFNEIIKRKDLPGYIVEGIAEQVGRELGIDPTEDKDITTDDEDKKKQSERQNADDDQSTDLASNPYFRQLTKAEKRVNLAELSRKSLAAEDQLATTADEMFTAMKEDTTARLRRLLDKGDLSKLKKFKLHGFAKYRKALEDAMMAQYLLGKRTAADEAGDKIPTTPSKSRQYITTHARSVAEKQEADLTFLVKAEVTKEIRASRLSENRELGVSDVIARVAAIFSSFVNTSVNTGIAVSLAGALNTGRADSFSASTGIDRMQYSAILDNRTTRMCKALDGSVVSHEEYVATIWKPPVHFNCRSIWVAVLKDDAFKPDYKPLPAKPGGQSAPQLSNDGDSVDLDDATQKLDYMVDHLQSVERAVEASAESREKLAELEKKLDELAA